jgi:predicted transcriptional regulator
MSVKVIINAFGNPTAAAKHQDIIGRLMKKMVCGDPEDPITGRNKNPRKIFEFCKEQWRSTEEISQHIGTHIETVRKITKAMYEGGSLSRMQKPNLGHVEYVYLSRDNTKGTNEERKIKTIKRRQAIVDHCTSWKSSREIAEELGFSQTNIQKHLKISIKDGRIERKGSGTQVFYRKKGMAAEH